MGHGNNEAAAVHPAGQGSSHLPAWFPENLPRISARRENFLCALCASLISPRLSISSRLKPGPGGKNPQRFPGQPGKGHRPGREGKRDAGARKKDPSFLTGSRKKTLCQTFSRSPIYEQANPLGLVYSHRRLCYRLHRLQHTFELWHPFAGNDRIPEDHQGRSRAYRQFFLP